jgi:hypothetical protein
MIIYLKIYNKNIKYGEIGMFFPLNKKEKI